MSANADGEDRRTYVMQSRDGDFFNSWRGTDWETVKRFAVWTVDKTKAARFTLADWQKSGHMDLVCGFSGCRLLQVK